MVKGLLPSHSHHKSTSAKAAHLQNARALSPPRQPPLPDQSGVVENMLAQDSEDTASLLAGRPLLLTPKFLAGNQQQQAMISIAVLYCSVGLYLAWS